MICEILSINTVANHSNLGINFTTFTEVDSDCTLILLVHDVIVVEQVYFWRVNGCGTKSERVIKREAEE